MKKEEEVVQTAESLKGKKAKLKPLKTEPTGTKELKLPREVKAGLEKHFGTKLSKVRVHVGGNAKDVCKEVRAQAFTIGNDIFLGKQSDAKNTRLLAHELTHVLQQGNGKMPKEKTGKALVSK